ncbi:MAG: hypothetical protein ACRD04_07865 [Terriglobales bacterium]
MLDLCKFENLALVVLQDENRRLVRRPSRFLIYEGQRVIADVPARFRQAAQNAVLIQTLPELLETARAVVDEAEGGFVSHRALERAARILDRTDGFTAGPWRPRGCSIWCVARRQRLIAHARDEEVAAATAGAPELAAALDYLASSAESEPVRRVMAVPLRVLQKACWRAGLARFWRAREASHAR